MLGTGIIKGLYITAKNLVGSYHDPKRLPTIEYPEKRYKLPENFRSFPFLVYDGDDAVAGLRCVACRICEKECPPQCIYIVPERDEKGRVQKKPKIFDIDFSVCMGCQLCVESCPFDSIKMDHHYEITARNRFESLLVHRDQLAKPNTYFHQIHPTDAAEIDARRAAKAVGASLAKPVVRANAQSPLPAPRAVTATPSSPATPAAAGQPPPPSQLPTQRASQAKPLHAAPPPAATPASDAPPPATITPSAPAPSAPTPDATTPLAPTPPAPATAAGKSPPPPPPAA